MRCPGSWGFLCASTSAKRLSGCSMRVTVSHRGTSGTSGHLFKATKAFLGESWENRDIMSRHSDIQAILHISLQKRAFVSQTLLRTTDWGFFSLKSPRKPFTSEQRLISSYATTYSTTSVLVAPLLWLNVTGCCLHVKSETGQMLL